MKLLTVNYLSMSFMMFFLPFNFPAVIALDRYGLRVGVLVGIIGTTLGLWIRCFIEKSFWSVIIGQTIIAFAQPCLYNAPAKVTTNWFAYTERAFATMVGTCANLLGVGFGFLVPKVFVDEFSEHTVYTPVQLAKFSTEVRNMLITISVVSSIIAGLCVVFFKEKPPTPPPQDLTMEL